LFFQRGGLSAYHVAESIHPIVTTTVSLLRAQKKYQHPLSNIWDLGDERKLCLFHPIAAIIIWSGVKKKFIERFPHLIIT